MVLHDIAVPVGAQGAIGADSTRTYCSAKHTTPCVVLDPLCAGCERRYVTTAAHGARVFDRIADARAHASAFAVADTGTDPSSHQVAHRAADARANTTRAARQRGCVSLQWLQGCRRPGWSVPAVRRPAPYYWK